MTWIVVAFIVGFVLGALIVGGFVEHMWRNDGYVLSGSETE
jgi:biotin transporter BioY